MDYDKFIQENDVDIYKLLKMIVHKKTEAVIFFKDKDSRIQYVNDRFFVKHKEFAQDKESVIGKTDFDLFNGNEHAVEAYKDEQEIMRTGEPLYIVEKEGVNEKGRAIIAHTQKYPIYNNKGEVIGIFGTTEDMTSDIEVIKMADQRNALLTKLNMELTKENTTDTLSGVNNRRFLRAELDSLYHDFTENKAPFCLLSLDIDDFKHINDNYGHEVGDEVIRFIASTLMEIKNSQYNEIEICRQGGDEFIIVIPYTNKDKGIEISKYIQKVFKNTKLESSVFDEYICMSMGLSEIREGESLRDILERIDRRLYHVKRHGKNGLCYEGE